LTVTITRISPTSDVVQASTPVVIEATGTAPFLFDRVVVQLGSTKYVVWDGTVWADQYAQQSVRTTLVAGKSYRYSVLPNVGWTGSPEVTVEAEEDPSVFQWANDSSIYLDGTDDRIYMPNKALIDGIIEYNQPFTIYLWLKTTSVSATTAYIFSEYLDSGAYNGWMLQYLASTNRLRWWAHNSGSNRLTVDWTPSPALNNGSWHCICLTHDGSGKYAGTEVYHNGSLAAGKTKIHDSLSATILRDTPVGMSLGTGGLCSLTRPWTGYFQSLGIWSRELSSVEVASISSAPVNLLTDATNTDLEVFLPLGREDTYPILLDRKGTFHAAMTEMDAADIVSDHP